MKTKTVIGKIDKVMQTAAKAFSYLGVIAIVIMAFLCVGDILAAKIFSSAIPNQTQWVQYGLIIVVYCFLASIVLGRGLMSVDILTRKFPKGVLKGIEAVSYICGIFIFGFIGCRGFILMAKHFNEGTRSATQTGAFKIWPFTCIYAIGLILLAIACLWRTIRIFTLPIPAGAKPESIQKKGDEE